MKKINKAIHELKKKCKHCNEEFTPSRWDKKYCNDSCKNAYNNRSKSKHYHITKEINDIFWNNREILKSFYRPGKQHVHIQHLRKAGFNFNYFTHQYETDNEFPVGFCYDFGFEQLDALTFKIVYHEKIQIDESL